MKFGVLSISFGKIGYRELAQKIGSYGFDATHLEMSHIADIGSRLGKLSSGAANLVAKEFARHGVRIPALGCYRNLINVDPEQRSRAGLTENGE